MIHFPLITTQQIVATTTTDQKRTGKTWLLLVLNQRSGMHMGAEDTAQSQNKYHLGFQSGLVVPA